ncbi:MAG: hypothetical protein FWH18_12085 [Marinilabiliaceae bacterium]|nr:hypothetical protein [Marinilabiliaceae bacterium]
MPTTSERLGAAAAYTNISAGDYISILHCLFCGATAAVAPNRQLAEVHFRASLHLVVWLHKIFGTLYIFGLHRL